MKTVIVVSVLGVYLVLALVVARFCAVNSGWERIARILPTRSDHSLPEPELKDVGDDPAEFPHRHRVHF